MKMITFSGDQALIDDAFEGTNFGDQGKCPEGRRRLVAECIMKLAVGFAPGWTIEQICKNLGALTPAGRPKKNAKQWAYRELMR